MKRKAIVPLLITGVLLFGCEIPVPNTSEEVTSSTSAVTTTADISTESDTSSSLTTIPTSEITTATTTFSTTSAITTTVTIENNTETAIPSGFDFDTLPSFSDSPYCEVNDNVPFFDTSGFTTESYEFYSPLDDLGRCGVCMASIGLDLMPTGTRGEIGSVRPTGFQLVRYDDIIADKYLFNRCHIIGWQLTGENANERNLITGTRYMNVEGMLPFENRVANYIKSTNNHVLYRVTPIFISSELVCRGVLMEAQSVEDDGFGVKFNVFCYNVQPQIFIDYTNGDNHLIEDTIIPIATVTDIPSDDRYIDVTPSDQATYILNTNTKKFHYPSCSSVSTIKDKNKQEYYGSRDDIIAQGYEPCKRCNP